MSQPIGLMNLQTRLIISSIKKNLISLNLLAYLNLTPSKRQKQNN